MKNPVRATIYEDRPTWQFSPFSVSREETEFDEIPYDFASHKACKIELL